MASEDTRKLFVAALPDSVTEDVLRDLFVESGAEVTELAMPRDRMSGRPRGFAFVRLGSQEDADRARQVLDGRIVDGRAISVRPFQAEPPGPRGPDRGPNHNAGAPRGDRGARPDRGPRGGADASDRTLYVGNLPYDATQEEVEALLHECGAEPVIRVILPMDQDGRRRGFGFVTLGSADVAKQALDQLRGAELRGRRLVINVAQPRGEGRPRADGGSGGPPPRAFSSEPRFAPAPPPVPPGFGPPMPGKTDGRRRKKFEDGGAGGRGRREHDDDSWRNRDDDE